MGQRVAAHMAAPLMCPALLSHGVRLGSNPTAQLSLPILPAGLWLVRPHPLAKKFMKALVHRVLWDSPWQWEQVAW